MKIRTSKAQESKGRIEGNTQERRKMTVNGSKDFFKRHSELEPGSEEDQDEK